MFCHLEDITGGEVKRLLKKRGVHNMNTMRAFFFNRFGAGQPDVLAERTALFLCVHMEDKLNELETEREYLLEMCPADKRDDYNPGEILTLVRLILDKLPKEYDAAVKYVKNLHKLRKYGKSGDVAHIANREDNAQVNYEDEWLPPYEELRIDLINDWRQIEKRRKECGKTVRRWGPGHPVLPIFPGHEHTGPHQRQCYRCGLFGHMGGDVKCKASMTVIWKGASAV
jgi:hypothetical protein